MKKFEYKVITITDVDDKELSKKLTELGKEGWEYCYYKAPMMQFIFKREALN